MRIFGSDFASVEKEVMCMEKMNLKNKNESVTRKIVKELLKRLRTARRIGMPIPAAITEELTHEFKRLWIYKRLHIRIG